MSRKLNLDPLAVTAHGKVLLNLAHFDVVRRPHDLLTLGTRQCGGLFIGVELSPAEIKRVQEHVGPSYSEVAGFVVGRRQKRSRGAR